MSFQTEQIANKVETRYSFTRTVFHFGGLIQTGLAGPIGTACKFIRCSCPVEREVVNWSAEAEGGPPICPSPYGAGMTTGLNTNLVLIDVQISGVVPVVIGAASPGHKFVQSGTYTYGTKVAADPLRSYPLGKMPFDNNLDVTDTYFPVANLQTGILDETISPPTPNQGLQSPIKGG